MEEGGGGEVLHNIMQSLQGLIEQWVAKVILPVYDFYQDFRISKTMKSWSLESPKLEIWSLEFPKT